MMAERDACWQAISEKWSVHADYPIAYQTEGAKLAAASTRMVGDFVKASSMKNYSS
jgi:hypothetical protein